MASTRSIILFISFLIVSISVFLATNGYAPHLFYHKRFRTYTPLVVDKQQFITYRGTHIDGVEHFQNIFYAGDTSGPNRFAPPVPIQHPPGTIVDGTTLGAFCPQGVGGPPLPFQSSITNISENCLSLRIARHSRIKTWAKLPVMVWIHGGGNALGSAADRMFQPDSLVQQAKANGRPIIFVGINYRLGIYGYATSKALINKKHTNVGLRDQRAAFEWVRRNIAAFGGDPDNVTAIGQSVGASSIGLHLTSYRGKQGVPFHKAIMMSGATGTNFNTMSPIMASNTANVAKSLNCVPEDSSSDSEETLLCLKNTSMEAINKFAISYPEDAKPRIGGPYFNPSYDGDYISERPSVSLSRGDFVKDLPLLLSWTTNDGAWFAPPHLPTPSSALATLQLHIPNLTPASHSRLEELYPLPSFSHLATPNVTASYHLAAQLHRDFWFTCPVLGFAQKYHRYRSPSSTEERSSSNQKTYLYAFNTTRYAPVFGTMSVPHWRVGHLSDIPYVFNTRHVPGGDNSPEQLELARRMSSSVINFAYGGDPNGKGGLEEGEWRGAFDGEGKGMGVMVVDGKEGGGGMVRIGNEEWMGEEEKGDGLQRDRGRGIRWERLVERCAFIDGIAEEVGV